MSDVVPPVNAEDAFERPPESWYGCTTTKMRTSLYEVNVPTFIKCNHTHFQRSGILQWNRLAHRLSTIHEDVLWTYLRCWILCLLWPRPPQGGGFTKWWPVSVCPSVCLSVACLDLTQQRKGLGSPTLAGYMEAYPSDNPWTYLEIKRSKVKITKPINAVKDNASNASPGNFRDAKAKVKPYSN